MADDSAPRIFPLPGTTLWKAAADEEFRERFHRSLGGTNKMVVPLYRIGLMPLLGAAKTLLLISTIGRKSGKRRFFPVGYQRLGGKPVVFSGWGERANWLKNIQASPGAVEVRLGYRTFQVRAELVEDHAEKRKIAMDLVTERPVDAQGLIGWDPGVDDPRTTDFTLLIEKIVMVSFTEKGGQNHLR